MIWILNQNRKKLGYAFHIDFNYYDGLYYVSAISKLERFTCGAYETKEYFEEVRNDILKAIENGDKLFIMPN